MILSDAQPAMGCDLSSVECVRRAKDTLRHIALLARREEIAWDEPSGGARAGDQERKQPRVISVRDVERKRGLCWITGAGSRRRSGLSMSGRKAPIHLGRRGSAETLMRTERGIVEEPEIDLLFEVAARKRRAGLQIEHPFESSPETLDDGDRSALADGSEALEDAEVAKRLDECGACELRAAVIDEVSGLPEPDCCGVDQLGEFVTCRFFREDLERERVPRKDVEYHDQLEDPDPEEARHVGDIGHPDVIRLLGPKGSGEGNDQLVFQRWFGSESGRILPVATDGLAADLPTGAREHLGDSLAPAHSQVVEQGDELPRHLVERAEGRCSFEERADGLLVRLLGCFINPSADRLRIDHEEIGGFLPGEAVRSHEDDDAKALFGRVADAVRQGAVPRVAACELGSSIAAVRHAWPRRAAFMRNGVDRQGHSRQRSCETGLRCKAARDRIHVEWD